ncbi:MAG: hypothetical protein Q7N87_02900 [Candidatus Uhrbacteria bacterium]|nr:hypothetical protein [Candidatus Uhrbacteria bacterium]MDP3793180.1 hypothetical protein [Candidatus Uhrbacteria bacterium]
MPPFEVPFDPKELERLRREQNPRKYGPQDRPQPQPEIQQHDHWTERRPEIPTDRPKQTDNNVTIIQFGQTMEEDEPMGDKDNRRNEK